MTPWKLATSDAPSRVDTFETIGSMSYNAQWVDSVATQFNASTLFVWSPDLAEGQIGVFNAADATTGASVLSGVARTVTIGSEFFVRGTTPSLAAVAAAPNRCCVLSASLILGLDFGMNTGVLRIMRLTDLMETLSIATISGLLTSEIHGVKEYILGGKQNICLRGNVHQKSAIGNMTSERSTSFDMGTSTALSGWIFAFTTIGAASAVPVPVVRLHAGLRVQRELTYPLAYLQDHLRTIPVSKLSETTRSSADPVSKPAGGEIREQMLKSSLELGKEESKKPGPPPLMRKEKPPLFHALDNKIYDTGVPPNYTNAKNRMKARAKAAGDLKDGIDSVLQQKSKAQQYFKQSRDSLAHTMPWGDSSGQTPPWWMVAYPPSKNPRRRR